ncbi:MAG: aminopeptidase [bacterium]
MVELHHAIISILKDCFKIKKNEKILILADEPQSKLAYEFYLKAKCLSKNPSLHILPKIKNKNFKPSSTINKLLQNSDIAALITSKSISHITARRKASQSGTRIASMPRVTEAMLKRNLVGNYTNLINISRKLADILTIGKEIHITTPRGTDLYCSISRKKGYSDTGMIHKPGNFSNIPAGEACIGPVHGSAQGTIIIDGSFPEIGLLKNPIKVSVKDGYGIRITGNYEVEKMRKILRPYGRESRSIGEIGIGTNPDAKLSGISLEDEKVAGTVHIGFGNDVSFGGTNNVACHNDAVLLKPTMVIDGKTIVKDGKIVV